MVLVVAVLPTRVDAATEEVKFEDPVLEKAIRKSLNLREGKVLDNLTLQSLQTLKPIKEEKIKSLKGLEKASNLLNLILPDQEIVDISPLQGLDKLELLILNNNQIKNICPAVNLTHLSDFDVSNNQIENIDCMEQSKAFLELRVNGNPVDDIQSIIDVKNLRELNIDQYNLNDKSQTLLSKLSYSGVVINQPRNYGQYVYDYLSVIINNDRVLFDKKVYVEEDIAFVQLRPLFEKLGFSVKWDEATNSVSADKDGVRLLMKIDDKIAKRNGTSIEMSNAPRLIDGYLFIPIQFVADAIGQDVAIDKELKRYYFVSRSNKVIASKDGSSQITVSGKWIYKDYVGDDNTLYFENNGSKIVLNVKPKRGVGSLDTFTETEVNFTKLFNELNNVSEIISLKVNGLNARQITYNEERLWGPTQITKTYIEGKNNFYILDFLTLEEYQEQLIKEDKEILQSFKEI
ncbi:stalk domain-containing protein [Paenibacillus sp. N1-5-1-14]|uniref:stalk domain-containing protein n=1 Tax=Paenibacillus radicibacter TaxID=2972488 RepID=UPI00215969F2|nr:stalk domain-containing protein [Paenibacillus radicibacter]MCR8644600.1 stalk domain-containing protein [Paenibacillus radicibacter]